MRSLFFINSLSLVLAVSLNEFLRTSLLNDYLSSMNYRWGQIFMQNFPFGSLPIIFGILSITVPLCMFCRKGSRGTQLSAASLMVMNPLLVYAICNIGYNQFALTLFRCGV